MNWHQVTLKADSTLKPENDLILKTGAVELIRKIGLLYKEASVPPGFSVHKLVLPSGDHVYLLSPVASEAIQNKLPGFTIQELQQAPSLFGASKVQL